MLSESYWQLFPNGKQWDMNRVYGSPSHCVQQTLWKAHGQRSLEGYHRGVAQSQMHGSGLQMCAGSRVRGGTHQKPMCL